MYCQKQTLDLSMFLEKKKLFFGRKGRWSLICKPWKNKNYNTLLQNDRIGKSDQFETGLCFVLRQNLLSVWLWRLMSWWKCNISIWALPENDGQTYTVSRSAVYPQISGLGVVLSPGGVFCTRRYRPAGTEPIKRTWTLSGGQREVRSSWFSSTLQPPLMREQWPWTKAVYTVQTQPWAAAHWLILRCVWERRGTPFSSFVVVSVNSVVGGRAHCGGQCFVLTQGLA